MKIHDRNPVGVSASETGKTQDTQKVERDSSPRSASSRASGSGDRVELSSLAGRVSYALGASAADRASRVDALGAAYRTGQYRPDSLATGRGMIEDSLSAGAVK